MAQAPGPITTGTIGANTSLDQTDAIIGADTDSQKSQEAVAQKSTALDSLRKLATEFKENGYDGRRRLLWVTTDKGRSMGAANSRFVEFLIRSDDFKETSDAITENLLKRLSTDKCSTEQKAIFTKICDNVRNGNATTVDDIVKLHMLMEHVTKSQEKGPEDYAFEQLNEVAQMAISAGRNKAFAWSQKNANFEARFKWFGNQASRKEAGEWLAALFQPAGEYFNKLDNDVRDRCRTEFGSLIQSLKEGNLEMHELVRLRDLVAWAKDPAEYAREKIWKWADWEKNYGPDRNITLSDTTRQPKPQYWVLTTESGRWAAGKHLMHSVSGLKPTLTRKTHQKEDYKRLEELANRGALKPRHGVYLQGILDQQKAPMAYAEGELERVYDMVEGASDKLLVWNRHQFNFELWDKKWNNLESSCLEAGERLADRLQGLKGKFTDDSSKKQFSELIEAIRTGQDVASQITKLHDLVEEQEKPSREAAAAIEKLEKLRLVHLPATARSVRDQLAELQSYVVEHRSPQEKDTFEKLLTKIGEDEANDNDIKAMQDLLKQAQEHHTSTSSSHS